MNKTKILIVTTVPETLATILKGQPRHLSGLFEVHLATSPGEFNNAINIHEGIKPHHISMARGINPIKDCISILSMLKLLRKTKPDIVHSYTPKAGLVAMLAAWICNTPIRIHTFTGLVFPTQTGIKKIILMAIARLICACSTRVVPEGKGVGYDLRQYSITEKPLDVIGHGNIAGVDTNYFSKAAMASKGTSLNLRKNYNIPDDVIVFCFVGRLNRDKGITELASAFSRLNNSPYLLVVGDLDHTAPVDTQTLDILRKHPRVHMLGFQQDIRPALLSADVLVLPSYREGFPNVILQAGSMQLPVIATDINGCNEIIEPEYNGWLVSPKNVASLQEAMQAAINTPRAVLNDMGRCARRRTHERFEKEAHWKRMVDFYQKEIGMQKLDYSTTAHKPTLTDTARD